MWHTYMINQNNHKFAMLIWSVQKIWLSGNQDIFSIESNLPSISHMVRDSFGFSVGYFNYLNFVLRILLMSKRKHGSKVIAPDSISDVEVCILQLASPRQQWHRPIGRPWSAPRLRSSLSSSSRRAPPSTCSRSSPPPSHQGPSALLSHNLCKRLTTVVPCN